jgi:hypothetical protein
MLQGFISPNRPQHRFFRMRIYSPLAQRDLCNDKWNFQYNEMHHHSSNEGVNGESEPILELLRAHHSPA